VQRITVRMMQGVVEGVELDGVDQPGLEVSDALGLVVDIPKLQDIVVRSAVEVDVPKVFHE